MAAVRKAKLIGAESLREDTRLLELEMLDAEALGFLGGQYIIIDSGIEWEGYDSFAATDNRLGGRLAARALGGALGGEGTAVLLRYLEGSASTTRREEGFLETLRTEFPGIELLSSDQYGGATVESCQRVAENLLNRYPEVDGVFAPNESATVAFVNALAGRGDDRPVTLVGFDASPPLVSGLRSGGPRGTTQLH